MSNIEQKYGNCRATVPGSMGAVSLNCSFTIYMNIEIKLNWGSTSNILGGGGDLRLSNGHQSWNTENHISLKLCQITYCCAAVFMEICERLGALRALMQRGAMSLNWNLNNRTLTANILGYRSF